MKGNMSSWDRIIRAIIGVALVVLAVTGALTGTIAVIAYVLAAVLALTALVGFCPLYRLLGIHTSRA